VIFQFGLEGAQFFQGLRGVSQVCRLAQGGTNVGVDFLSLNFLQPPLPVRQVVFTFRLGESRYCRYQADKKKTSSNQQTTHHRKSYPRHFHTPLLETAAPASLPLLKASPRLLLRPPKYPAFPRKRSVPRS